MAPGGPVGQPGRHARWLDGLVVSGGEPTLAPGLPDFVAELTALGPAVKIDTNGMRPDVVAEVLARTPGTHFSVDVKAPFAKYALVTGGAVDEASARERLGAVFALAEHFPQRFAFRTTLVPELAGPDLDGIREVLPSGCPHTLQPFRDIGKRGEERRHDPL